MNDLGWTAPSRPVDAGTARKGILWQHERLRTLLERAQALAAARLDGEPSPPDAVASAIGDIHLAIEVHLRFEEAVLLPLLRDDLPVGPERADWLVEEHVQQRGVLAALHKEASTHPELPLLASKLAALTCWLLADMVEEERSLLDPDAVRDDIVVVRPKLRLTHACSCVATMSNESVTTSLMPTVRVAVCATRAASATTSGRAIMETESPTPR